MQISSQHVNEYGQLVGFRVHDARVIGFSHQDEGPFSLQLLRIDGSVARLSFRGVDRFGFRGFRNGAIILDIYFWDPQQTPPWHASDPEGAWAVLFGNDYEVSALPSAVERVLENRESGYLVFVECSYGGSIALLCESMELDEE